MSNKLTYEEAKEIAGFITQTEIIDDDYAEIENALFNKFNVTLEDFEEICGALFDLIDFSVSPLTSEAYVGFGDKHMWIAKKEVNQQFIRGLIEWCSEGEDIEPGKGFKREITLNGEVEFIISIERPEPKTAEAGK